MKEARPLNLTRLVIVAAVVLVLLIVLLFWARDIVQEVVVLPVSYLFWAAGVIVRSTPQMFFWVALLVITFLVAYRGVSQRRKVLLPVPPRPVIDEMDEPLVSGRVTYWNSKVSLLREHKGSYFHSSFHTAVGRLLVEQLAYRYHLPVQEVEARLRDNTLDVPPEVHEYALYHLRRPEVAYRNFFDMLWHSIADRILAFFLKYRVAERPDPADQRLTTILQYMEKELEVINDDTGR